MQQLAERWARWGHRPVVLTRTMPGLPKQEVVNGVEINRIIRTAALGPAFGASFIASLVWQLLRRAPQYDVAVAGQIPWEAVATGIVNCLSKKPTVVFAASTGRDGDVQQVLSAKGSRLLRALVLRNSRWVALSAQGREELMTLGCPDESIIPSTNGVDIERFQPGDGNDGERRRTVLYLSRLVPAKNPHVLLRAWKLVNAEGRYRLLIAGDGPLAGELRQLAEQLDLHQVEFLGHVDDVSAAHRRASVFVLPSPSEGCSNALLEAMAGGLCPVVTRVPGNIDVVQEEVNGLLFDHDNDRQLAAVVSRALTDEPLRRRLSASAREHVVENHNLDQIAGQFIELFRALRPAA